MHEVGDVNIPAILFAIVVVCVFYHLIWRQVKASEARNIEVRKLQQLAAEEVALIEREAAEDFRLASEFQLSQQTTTSRRRANFGGEKPRSSSLAELSGSTQARPNHDSYSARITSESSSSWITNESSSSWITNESSSAWVTGDNSESSLDPVITGESSSGRISSLSPSVESGSVFHHQASFAGSGRISASRGICVVCSAPTKKQCSRCKAVKYCSELCQVKHWREGHKHECHELEKQLLSSLSQSNAELISNNLSSSQSSIPIPSKYEDSGFKGILPEEKLPRATRNTLQPVDPAPINQNLPKPTKVQILFPYDHFIELFTWDKLRLPPCGLVNLGNTCFANVVLQCLTYTRPLAAYLLEGHHKKEECQRSVWCFMCELKNHINTVKEGRSPFQPKRIVAGIQNIGSHMGSGRQEDAHEFMRFAIDSMQSICFDKVGGHNNVDSWMQETTLIQHIFGGYLRSQVRCMQCQHESYKYENMMDLAVEIQGNLETLEDALAQFTAMEWLDDDNKYKCDRCDAYVKAWKRLVIHKAPNILTIALKRFQSGKFGKLNKRVAFPNVLDITPFMSKENDDSPRYELYGVVVHIDMLNSSFFGHYICYVKDLHGFWYKIDDSTVKEVNLAKVMQQKAYMLLYKRLVPRPGPLIHGGDGDANVNSHSSRATIPNGGISRSAFYRSRGNGDILSNEASYIY